MEQTTFEDKRRKFLPRVPKATGQPTPYLEGYPTEDGQPMSATEFHGRQISILNTQLTNYLGEDTLAYVGTDSFVYYEEGNRSKVVAPDIYVALGVSPAPLRRSFYTWAEGATPTVVFEFLSDSTARVDRGEKLNLYFSEIGIYEYFIHQPEVARPSEFCAWRRQGDGYQEIVPDDRGALYSQALNLWFMVEQLPNQLRLMRPYLPDGTPMETLDEAKKRMVQAKDRIAQMEAEIARLREALEQQTRS